MSTVIADAKPPGKTKAKQRYLRRKKEKRKQKKTKKPNAKPQKETSEEEEEYDEDGDVTMETIVVEPTAQKPLKKRRKVDVEDEELPIDEAMQVDKPEPPATQTGSLPSFPIPVHPDLPSQSDLALQGLDKALVDAEFVDPSNVLDIPLDGTDDGGTGLGEKLRKRLHDLGITQLFAVQTTMLPFLLPFDPLKRALYRPYDPPQDVCVSAPTGSGKTLAYVLPIVELLSTRIVTRLRALIVLPTRDLVIQVRETFEAMSRGRGLKIGTATGQHSFVHEQAQLVADTTPSLQGGSSKVDILICTPGRLIDHINGTPNFSLQHLRFLVIDEADRLLAQSFQDWLAQVLAATRPPSSTPHAAIDSNVPKHDAVAPAFQSYRHPALDGIFYVPERKEPSCQKLLFSATLTRDPSKIAALELRNPKYFVIRGKEGQSGLLDVVMEKFSMPETLSEYMIICEPSQKPLQFFYLIHAKGVVNSLVFTKSAESTIRLVQLLQYFEDSRTKGTDDKPVVVHSYSSDLGAAERKSVLEKFKKQEIHILVCSDLISRGIDISHVSHVVSYDAPVDMRKYVHRVGRTARAGRQGSAWTLVEEQEARYFKNLLKAADHLEQVKRVRVNDKDKEMESLKPPYEKALEQLKDAYSRTHT